MEVASRLQVRQRAQDCCEYCRLPQFSVSATFHIEHIVAKQHRGPDDLDNLALACPFCNRFKGPNLSAFDPLTGAIVPLFHPRREKWSEHFAIEGIVVGGLTPTGRATVALLEMNDENRLEIRGALYDNEEWP